jgi:predicted Zn-dependent protease with MMP-like domain
MTRGGARAGCLTIVILLLLVFAVAAPWPITDVSASPLIGGSSGSSRHCVDYPNQGSSISGHYGGSNGIGGLDVTGCVSWIYEELPVLVPASFFAGTSFRPGVTAYEYGAVETTEIHDGHQVDVVSNPTPDWLTAYRGFDRCASQSTSSNQQIEICTVAAVHRYAGSWLWFIPIAAVLVAVILFVLHFARPAGPIRRRRRFRRHHGALATSAAIQTSVKLTPAELRRIQRRLRRLEGAITPELSQAQHQWFTSHLAAGRHGAALASLAAWFAEGREPLPSHLRDELSWLASSLGIEHVVTSALEARRAPGVRRSSQATDHDRANGLDVSVAEFQALVADAVDALPVEFRQVMDNVAISVEDAAESGEPFGRYVGIPLTNRRLWSVQPDKIIVYRTTICAACDALEQVRALVYATVIHEVARHFGISEPALEALGW